MSPAERGPHADETVATRPGGDARRMAEALSDPLRADIFDVLAGWLHTATVQQIAKFLGEQPEAVARELAVLEASDLVEPLASAGARPGDSPPYRATREGLFSDEEWAQFPPELRRRFLSRLLDKMHARIRTALGNGGFDAPDVHVSWMSADLDGLGYNDTVRLLAETLNRARDIEVAAVERRAAGAADDVEVKSSLMMVHFLDDGEPSEHDETAGPSLTRVFALADDIADQVAVDTPDWERLAESAAALAGLARRRAAANVVR